MFNMIAGGDTKAITIRAVFYHVLKDPRVSNRREKDVVVTGFADKVPLPFNDAHNIPYLNVCGPQGHAYAPHRRDDPRTLCSGKRTSSS
jgi:hypothetical protein